MQSSKAVPMLLTCVSSHLLNPDFRSVTYAGRIVMMNQLAFSALRSADGERSGVMLNRHELS